MVPVLLVLIFCNVLIANSFAYLFASGRGSHNDNEGPGTPLLLTPYIENGLIKDARNLSRVEFPGLPEITSYSGFFTVEKKYNSNQFLWYFPAKSYIEEQIVILWLQGGPGASSLFGLFEENGPIEIVNKTFKERKVHWALHHHLIYIDNPVGTGFSFTNDSRGYCTEQTQIGEHLHTTLIQFFQMFPELQKFKFFISGESYAGKYAPSLARTIHIKNSQAPTQKINLKGLMIGNGWCDPINQINYGDYLYQIGLMDWNQKKHADVYQNRVIELIKKQSWGYATNALVNFTNYINNTTGIISEYNYLPSSANIDWDVKSKLIQTTSIRRAIHVGNLTYSDDRAAVIESLMEDIPKSVAPWISELLDHYPILFYNGQVDIIVAYPLTVNFLRHLNFSASEEYSNAKRFIVFLSSDSLEEIGFAKTAGNLTEMLIRGAGHMVPMDKPNWIYNYIIYWRHCIDGKSIDGDQIISNNVV